MILDGGPLTIEEIIAVARHGERVVLSETARERVARCRRTVEDVLKRGSKAYGINTGFGKLCDVSIPPDKVEVLQENLIRSHSCGLGDPLSEEEVRAAMLLRANALARGMSGVRVEVVEKLLELLNHRVTPVVPSRGSVGASGDLAPLSHIALVLMGEGEAWVNGMRMPGSEALKRCGIVPLKLSAKEGLALINGVQVSAGILALTVGDAACLADAADIIAALSAQALDVIPDAFDDGLVSARPYPGARTVAAHMRALLEGSGLTSRPGETHMQDAYSLRCIPQVHGAVRDAIDYARRTLEIESGSSTDNPLILEDGRVISGGNFHGQPVAFAADFLSMGLTTLMNISERRIARMLNSDESRLPAFLAKDSGLESGYMLLQYTAASLCAEARVLSSPASVQSIPTSANQEDHVSMSATAALKCRRILDHLVHVLAIEYLVACQALEYRGPDKLAPLSKRAYNKLRERVMPLDGDRNPGPDIAEARKIIVSGELFRALQAGCENWC
ncbi:MAG: histidine ammonia-lyase [Firmicutes bacterium]|nr:histidine ammonia-lyase [Candidatus Fermentithermobacillaceae bacterium]